MDAIDAVDTMTTAPHGTLAPVAHEPGRGEHLWFFGGLTTIKPHATATGGRVMVTENPRHARFLLVTRPAGYGLEILGPPGIPA